MNKMKIALASALVSLLSLLAACQNENKIIILPVAGQSTLFKEPYLVMTDTASEIKIVWQTPRTTECAIAWGDNTLYDLGENVTTENSAGRNQHLHSYTITGLVPGAVYYYRVTINEKTYTGSFRAAAAASATDLNFMIYGDTRTLTDIHNTVAGAIISALQEPSYNTFILGAGDLVSSGEDEDVWEREFFNLGNVRRYTASVPFISAVGNHDLGAGLFEKYFPYPYETTEGRYWSFDYGPVHISVIDQYIAYDSSSAQYAWLENDLSASAKTWKFIILHQPGWSAGGGHANDTTVQTDIQPLCETHDVSIVFAGHNHYYARAIYNSVYHITTGGGGAPLHTPESGQPNVVVTDMSNHFCRVEIAGNTLNFYAERPDGTIIDSFNITK
ncbi:MAG: metallophosphoesterase family protein [Spirochaetes bacterium]|nr:metallophosphoesterase family protein [Spirochaetota bacterium]